MCMFIQILSDKQEKPASPYIAPYNTHYGNLKCLWARKVENAAAQGRKDVLKELHYAKEYESARDEHTFSDNGGMHKQEQPLFHFDLRKKVSLVQSSTLAPAMRQAQGSQSRPPAGPMYEGVPLSSIIDAMHSNRTFKNKSDYYVLPLHYGLVQPRIRIE